MLRQEGNEKYKATLEGIKAPLGVILYLIKRDNLDVYDIPIAKVTKDYLDYLDLMEQHRIELAGEFFVLAATLMRIKAQMLLRRDEDEEDPRQELVRNLLEYKKMVEAARSFQSMEQERLNVFTRPVPQHEKEFRGEPVFELSMFEIMRAFREVAAELEGEPVNEFEREAFTIDEKIEVILSSLAVNGQVSFRDLFKGMSSRFEVIVTFIAMLELMKRLVITVRQETAFGNIWVYQAEEQSTDESKVAVAPPHADNESPIGEPGDWPK
jgi:segregation and condensation protein A